MTEKKREAEMGKVCRSCNRHYPTNETMCEDCTVSLELSWETPVVKENPASSAANSATEACEIREPEHERPAGKECPQCGTDMSALFACPRCGKSDAGYRLCWQDAELGKTSITRERPIFVGRVPPVDHNIAIIIEKRYPTVSRTHAELFIGEQGSMYARDMGSRNGTYINGRQIAAFEREEIHAGDELSFSSMLKAKVESK